MGVTGRPPPHVVFKTRRPPLPRGGGVGFDPPLIRDWPPGKAKGGVGFPTVTLVMRGWNAREGLAVDPPPSIILGGGSDEGG